MHADERPETVADLLANDRFVAWVQSNGTQYAAEWETWLKADSSHVELLAEARDLLTMLNAFPGSQEPPPAKWEAVSARIHKPLVIRARLIRWGSAAAVLLLGLFAWWFTTQNPSDFRTLANEQQQIELPDGTQVTMAPNSHVWWEGDWASGARREVHLNGEAIFEVVPAARAANKALAVYAGETTIEVLGTTFNVMHRANRQVVTLLEGKVAIHNGEENYLLNPDEQWVGSTASVVGKALVRPVNAATVLSWRDATWNLSEASLLDVAERMEAYFGIEVMIEDPFTAQRKLTGTLPAKDVEIILSTLEKTFRIQAEVRQDTVYISDRISD